MARFFFCCVHDTGLERVIRTLAVARQVRRTQPDAEILILMSSESAGVLWREGIASVKVPSVEVLKEDKRLTSLYAILCGLILWVSDVAGPGTYAS